MMIKLIAFIAALSANSSYQGADTLNRQELNCLSRAVYHEARGEPMHGQTAVAHVVLNRVNSEKYPDSVCEVVYQSKQFTGLYPHLDITYDENAIKAAVLSYIGFVDDPTGGALFYHNPAFANPYHYKMAYNEITIKNHLFYNLEGWK